MKHSVLLLALAATSCMSYSSPFGPADTVDCQIDAPDAAARVNITLRNANGMEVEMSNLGATVTAVRVPDRGGRLADVTLGFDGPDGYLSADNQYFGCTVGRVANRIALGKFELDGRSYSCLL